jgi:hypothetical protein
MRKFFITTLSALAIMVLFGNLCNAAYLDFDASEGKVWVGPSSIDGDWVNANRDPVDDSRLVVRCKDSQALCCELVNNDRTIRFHCPDCSLAPSEDDLLIDYQEQPDPNPDPGE